MELRGGEGRMEPQREEDAWRITLPAGTDELMLVCAPAPLPLKAAASRSGDEVSVALYSYLIRTGAQ
jgi:hypothetical protein